MKFRVTIEQFKHNDAGGCSIECEGEDGWQEIHKEEFEICVAERASRMIQKIVQDEGLDINFNVIRKILFEELHEKK